jgi:hypothetical protein
LFAGIHQFTVLVEVFSQLLSMKDSIVLIQDLMPESNGCGIKTTSLAVLSFHVSQVIIAQKE